MSEPMSDQDRPAVYPDHANKDYREHIEYIHQVLEMCKQLSEQGRQLLDKFDHA